MIAFLLKSAAVDLTDINIMIIRDIEWNFGEDKHFCLHKPEVDIPRYSPLAIRRVSQIFNEPEFFKDGVASGDIVQGKI